MPAPSLQSYFANPPGLGLLTATAQQTRLGNVLISCPGRRGKVSVTQPPSPKHMTALLRVAAKSQGFYAEGQAPHSWPAASLPPPLGVAHPWQLQLLTAQLSVHPGCPPPEAMCVRLGNPLMFWRAELTSPQ